MSSAAWIAAFLLVAAPAKATTLRFVSAGDTLVGELALPPGPGAHPVVVVLHGSERGVRENRFVTTLRDLLLPAGIGVFSFDKRGVGDSQGTYMELPDLNDAAADGLAAVDAVARHEGVAKIGALGVSQGGWVAPLMASKSPRVAFVVSVSGDGLQPETQGLWQRAAELREAGLSEDAIEEANQTRVRLFDAWRDSTRLAAAGSAWALARLKPWFARACETDEVFTRMKDIPHVPPARYLPPDLVLQLKHALYDPIPAAERLQVPVLHVYGEGDRHVPVEASMKALRAAYARSGNKQATFRVFPRAGHFLQQLDTPFECLRCEMPPYKPAPGYPEVLRDWIVSQTR